MKYKKKRNLLSTLYSTRIIETKRSRFAGLVISFLIRMAFFSSTRGGRIEFQQRERERGREFLQILETRSIDSNPVHRRNLATKIQKIR